MTVDKSAALDSEVTEELRFHVERQIQANVDAGMRPDDARRAAHLPIGSVDAIREESRITRPGALLHQIGRDLASPSGALLGLVGAILLTLAMKSLLYGVTPLDPVGFLAAATLLFVVALVASYLPARRAARTHPATALRAE